MAGATEGHLIRIASKPALKRVLEFFIGPIGN
jgi:hypothetical protein